METPSTSTKPLQKQRNNGQNRPDGFNFQCHMFYYTTGLINSKKKYFSAHYEAGKPYGALDDLVIKVYPNENKSKLQALYMFQAKQCLKKENSISIADLLSPKDGIGKYISSCKTYESSETCKTDGKATQMIYWTCMDLHSITKNVMIPVENSNDHLELPADVPIEQYRIDWKKLCLFQIALILMHCVESKYNELKNYNVICKPLAQELIREVAEQIEVTAESDVKENRLKLRTAFIENENTLSENAAILRKFFNYAYETKGTTPPYLEELKTRYFEDKFGYYSTVPPNTAEKYTFMYKEALEPMDKAQMNDFFARFIFFVNVPKELEMNKLLQKMYDGDYSESVYQKHLIGKPLVDNNAITQVTEIVQLNEMLRETPLMKKVVQFAESRFFNKQIESFLKMKDQAAQSLTIIAKTCDKLTLSGLVKVLKKTSTNYLVVYSRDTKRLYTGINAIGNDKFCEEYDVIVAVNLKNSLQLPDGQKVIYILPPDSKIGTSFCCEDEVDMNDIDTINYDMFVEKISFNGTEIQLKDDDWKKIITSGVHKIFPLLSLEEVKVQSNLCGLNGPKWNEQNIERYIGYCVGAKVISRITFSTEFNNKPCLMMSATTIISTFRSTNRLSAYPFEVFDSMLQFVPMEPSSSEIKELVKYGIKNNKIILVVYAFEDLNEDDSRDVYRYLTFLTVCWAIYIKIQFYDIVDVEGRKIKIKKEWVIAKHRTEEFPFKEEVLVDTAEEDERYLHHSIVLDSNIYVSARKYFQWLFKMKEKT